MIKTYEYLMTPMSCGHPAACLVVTSDEDGDDYCEVCSACKQQAKAVAEAEARCREEARKGAYVVKDGSKVCIVGDGSVGYLFVENGGTCYFERPPYDFAAYRDNWLTYSSQPPADTPTVIG